MLNILISDIVGLTKPFKELSLSLRGENLIIDPYNREMLNFSSEEQPPILLKIWALHINQVMHVLQNNN